MSAPFVTVVIVNYNSGGRLAKCLDCLMRQTFQDFETIVIDNGSTDGSAKPLKQAEIDIRLVEAGANLGFAAANNLAVKEAKGAWLAFLNPDAYALPNWLEVFARAVEAYPDIDAFGSAQLDAKDQSRIDGAGDVCHALGLYYRGHFGWPAAKFPRDGECFSPCAAAAFYRRTVFENLGGFDERFFCYGEDVDLGFRLRLSGGRAVQLARAKVLHEGSGVTGRDSDFSIYYGTRNRLWVYYKNIPFTALLLLTPIHVLTNGVMLARAALSGKGAAYWRGLRDGLKAKALFKKEKGAAEKKLGAGAVLSLLTWSPIKLMRRGADIRPIGKKS